MGDVQCDKRMRRLREQLLQGFPEAVPQQSGYRLIGACQRLGAQAVRAHIDDIASELLRACNMLQANIVMVISSWCLPSPEAAFNEVGIVSCVQDCCIRCCVCSTDHLRPRLVIVTFCCHCEKT